MKVIHALAISIFTACLAASIASAQTYPNRPVTMVVAFPPGGADDATARILQDPMQKALGQPIVVENVGGAGGMIGAAKAARAEPDGYTILLHQDALAGGHDALSEPHVRRREGFRSYWPRQYHRDYAGGTANIAAE
jgi:tripartite-type tricarboxylate transporter receptor subunit TctC